MSSALSEREEEQERDGKVAFCGRQMRRSNDCHVNSAERGREEGGDLNRRTKLPGGVHTVLPAYS